MRSDVKLGLAVGGILLAVLIVYVLVVPGSEQPGAELATTAGSSEDITIAPEKSDEVSRDPVDPETSVAVPPEVTSDAEPKDEVVKVEANDPFDNTQANAAQDGGDWDWNKLLNPSDTPTLMSTDVSTGEPTGGTGGTTAPQVNETTRHPQVVNERPISQVGGPVQPPVVEPIEIKPANTEAGAARTHKVAEGETFSSIAAAAYGASRYYPHIMRANPNVDPSRLKPGTVINLPALSEVKPAGADEPSAVSNTSVSSAKQVDSKTEYRVVSGDSLERISIKLYGKRDRLHDIYELNKEAMGNDPSRLKVGQVLKLPAVPTVTVSAN